MGAVNGRMYICDRCGATEFVKHTGTRDGDGGYTVWDTFDPLSPGWAVKNYHQLCPKCAKAFDELEKRFMNCVESEGG